MLKKLKHNITEVTGRWHDQFAVFKSKVRMWRDREFPQPCMEIEGTSPHIQGKTSRSGTLIPQIPKRIWAFWVLCLAIVAVGALLYSTLAYVYLVMGAFIISLAMESVVMFWQRLTRSRGIGMLITYALFILFVSSGFVIIVPFVISLGTQILQHVISFVQGVQGDILTQGPVVYIQGLTRIPSFLQAYLVEYVSSTNPADVLQVISQNLGNIVNMSSAYLKLIGEYTINLFGQAFFAAGKIVIFFVLCILFSLSFYEIKRGITYLLRNVRQSKSKIDKVYSGVASWLRSQLLICVLIGTMAYGGLWILELMGYPLPHRGTLVLLVSLLEVIPYLGPILGALPVMLLGLVWHGFGGFIAALIVYTIIQQIEGSIMVPVFMSKTLGINATLVFVCMLFGGLLMGILGVILATPVALIISIACEKSQKK